MVLVLWNAAVVTGVVAFLTGIKGGLLWLALLLLTAALLFYVYHLEQIQEKRHKSNPGPGIRWSVYVSRAFAVYAVALLIYSSQGTELPPPSKGCSAVWMGISRGLGVSHHTWLCLQNRAFSMVDPQIWQAGRQTRNTANGWYAE